jgi:hypothetical protein
MEAQDRLDALLSSRRSSRRRWTLPQSQREELEPLLDLADELAVVRNVLPAPSFADGLETRLLARASRQAAGALEYAPGSPLADTIPPAGNGSARDEDDEDYAPTAPVAVISSRGRQSAPRRTSRGRRWRGSWRVWSSLAAAIFLVVSIASIVTLSVAANAGPGSALYSVRRWQEDARTNLANSDAERAQLHLQYATDALDALDAAVAQHAPASVYGEALSRFTDEMRQAADALAQVPAGTDYDTLTSRLDDMRVRGRLDLRAALPSLSWSGRIATTSALGALGESVVTVTRVTGVRTGLQYARVWTLTITGSGFQSGAVLLAHKRPAGHVVSVTPTRMIAQYSGEAEDSLARDIGVGNLDGTAATTSQVTGMYDDSGAKPITTPGGGSGGCGGELEDHSASCTPTPQQPTPQH